MNCIKNNMFITLSVKLILIHAVSINIDTAIKKKTTLTPGNGEHCMNYK